MIRDWRTVPCESSPIGEPFYAHPLYLAPFCVLEALAMGRVWDLASVPFNTSAGVLVCEEILRRERLE